MSEHLLGDATREDDASATLGSLQKTHGLLVVFTSNSCPFVVGNGDKSEGWERRYPSIAAQARKLDIGVAFVNSNEANRADLFERWGKAEYPEKVWREDFIGQPLRVRLSPLLDAFLVSRYKEAAKDAHALKLTRSVPEIDSWFDRRYLNVALKELKLDKALVDKANAAFVLETLSRAGISLQFSDNATLRSFNAGEGLLAISGRASSPTQRFQLLLQVALITQNALLEATLDLARFHTPEARDIAKMGLANYFAGAALIVVASKEGSEKNGEVVANVWHAFDAGAAWMSMALQAQAMGLVAHAMGGFEAKVLAPALHLPDGYIIHAVVAFGTQGDAEDLPEKLQARENPSPRRPVADVAGHGRFPA